MNYMIQDLLGIIIGILLFIPVLLIPGYVTGYFFDLFDFKKRQPFVRFGIGLLLSCAISPILFFLTYRLISNTFTLVVLSAFAIIFALILFREHDLGVFFKDIAGNRSAKVILWIAVLWTIFATLILIDVQWGNQLYFNTVAYDYSTRVAIVNAITRSGIPPINPSFYPGEPVRLTFLYYFWYILCSLVDQLGGNIVDSRAALIASVIWVGLALIAAVALYLRIRNIAHQLNTWNLALKGIGLLAVSGLDLLGGTFFMVFPRFLAFDTFHLIDGDIEQWNEQITAWIGTAFWTPHHLAGLLNCILGWMLIVYHLNKKASQKGSSAFIAGMAFASAFGLSSWITLIFIFFWIIWMVTKLLNGDSLKSIWSLLLPGIVSAVVILPYALDLLSNGGGSTSTSQPLAFDVRWFWPVTSVVINLPVWERRIINLFLLPLNYFLELGFFLFVGIYWYHYCGKNQLAKSAFARGEIILLLTSAILATFAHSTIIDNNDFGWRGWLPGQFILLIWGSDIISYVWSRQPIIHISLFRKPASAISLRILLTSLLAMGVLTSLEDVFLLRTWPLLVGTGLLNRPNHNIFSGTRVYEARTVYKLIDSLTPPDLIVQSNPQFGIDRPAGLYQTRNSAIINLTLFGVAPETYKPLWKEVANIFTTENGDWQSLDSACQRYSIDILIIRDSDGLWKSLDTLKSERQPLYMGKYYSAFYCGGRLPNGN